VQILLPFNEFLLSDEYSELYQKMIDPLPDIHKVPRDNVLAIVKSAILAVRKSMNLLNIHCQNHPFPTEHAEIQFFKLIKPRFHAQLIYWTTLFDIELHWPVGGLITIRKYIKKNIKYVEVYFEKNIDFYNYYRTGQTDRDALYFLRNSNLNLQTTNNQIVGKKPLCSSSYILARLLGNNLIKDYLFRVQSHLKTQSFLMTKSDSISLHVTESKSSLAELVYILYSEGILNHGRFMANQIIESPGIPIPN
jgi:hypothetical protein